MKDIFDSIKDNFAEKLGNPFAGTFIISWTILHWKLLFTLFNFDSYYTLDEKINCMEYYLQGGMWDLLILPILCSLSSIAVYHTLNNTSNLIVRFFNRRVKPLVYKIAWKADVIDIDTHNKLEKLFMNSQKEFSEVARENADLQTSNKELKDQNEKMTLTFHENTRAMQHQATELEGIRNNLALKDQEIIKLKNDNVSAEEFFDDLFQGDWQLDYNIVQGNNPHKGSEKFSIKNRVYKIKGSNASYNIEDITWNQKTRRLCFRKVGNNQRIYNELQVDENYASLTGIENNGWSEVHYFEALPF